MKYWLLFTAVSSWINWAGPFTSADLCWQAERQFRGIGVITPNMKTDCVRYE